ncbi:sulfite exporter TauE/SafE family protein [Qipengyuania vesicularis]|uniref:sulfite exporter TauE/SafE family protein n=1 Tax=Qipengyuania vesicularis TaxID=2867232 RepID=UPI001C8806B8|nr:sulfite exporter TauE/SafE family protein [Qipengyuania vesicularis]MBX7527691.1 sulfite exporter TauE/SafE family protein [Qipengyuania vesicularis]
MAETQPRLNSVQPTLAHTSRLAIAGGAVLLLAYLACWLVVPSDPELMTKLLFLPGVGVIGAIIANASGTGGGVVFVPVFNALRDLEIMQLDPLQVVAVSMGIQAFGMSLGALRWTDRLYHQHQPASLEARVRARDYWIVSGAVLALSLPAMLATQRLIAFDGQAVLMGYKMFSIALGLALIVATWTFNRSLPEKQCLARGDLAALLLIAIPGGAITALFSVGIGELVAFYLFLRHYPMVLCVGTACVISAVSCIAGLLWHIDAQTVQWEVVLLAAPGAMLGAFLARPIALWLGARRLKTAGGVWIIASALYLLWLNAN